MQKALSVLRALALLFSVLTASVSAAVADDAATGVAPEGATDNCSWTLASDGTLTLSGTGVTDFYETFRFSDERIKKIVVGEGITAIGDDLFSNCSKATELTLPSTLVSIGDRAFLGCSKLTSVTMPASLKSIGSQAFSDCYALNSVTLNWGSESMGFSAESGVEYPAAFDGQNIYFDVEEDGTAVTLRLDLTGFDPRTLTGATYTVTIGDAGEESGGALLGDVDRDGKVDIFDASAIQKSLAGTAGYPNYSTMDQTGLAFRIADVDRDGKVDIFDASLIQKWLAGDSEAKTYGIGEPLK